MNKSAYSFSTNKQKIEDHIIVVWVDNESGVLARVVGLFSGRGYNIDSLAVAEVDKKKKYIKNNDFHIRHSTSASANKAAIG
jgi:glycine cleavage system regulatory protein